MLSQEPKMTKYTDNSAPSLIDGAKTIQKYWKVDNELCGGNLTQEVVLFRSNWNPLTKGIKNKMAAHFFMMLI
jgi:hypothetical protein